ncbi:plasmid recombination protein [Nitrosospira sp. Nsp13]|uniref:plasmid recombination protein n=1 Tax=Nitrosospira sp. Nsp13 TaxID=1855332 RepID=UPI0008878D5A|nr:plasmid recombination protein [Nitrosospira sp. Nsp13]SCY13712.1 Plasmid recombination enzyme [Nitrosospira sp. Nsp13]
MNISHPTTISPIYSHPAPFLVLKKLRGNNVLRIAAKHNLRELQAEIGADDHINPSRTGMNQILAGAGTASDVAAAAEHLMHDAGVGKLRRDAIRALEIVVSLPPAAVIDLPAFFSEVLNWVRDFFNVPILSAVLHLDEAAPHCHILLLPLVNGHMVGSDLVGYRNRLREIQTSFYQQVGQPYGLSRPKSPQRLNSALRHKCASIVYTAIVDNPDLLLKPEVEVAVLEAFGRNAESLFVALGLTMPTQIKLIKSFVDIMTAPCPPEPRKKHIGFTQAFNHIGFASTTAANNQTLSCVGFEVKPPHFACISAPTEDTFTGSRDQDTYTREYDDDNPAEHWDSERGEFWKPPTKPSTVRDAAMREMERGLVRVRH